jgi:hypothetical protein
MREAIRGAEWLMREAIRDDEGGNPIRGAQRASYVKSESIRRIQRVSGVFREYHQAQSRIIR